MKTITLKTAQSKFKVVKLSDIESVATEVSNSITTNLKSPLYPESSLEHIPSSNWLKFADKQDDKSQQFILCPQLDKFTKVFTSSIDSKIYEGLLINYLVKWNEEKNDWYVYTTIAARPVAIEFSEEKSSSDFAKDFENVQLLTLHRKLVFDKSTDKVLKRPSTSCINHLLIK
jgi:hypothetical protein